MSVEYSQYPTSHWLQSALVYPTSHVHVVGGGVAVHSKNKARAVKLLEFLTEKTAQDLYGRINYEFPVNPIVEAGPEVKSWGTFKEDQQPISRIATLIPVAQRVIDRVGW